MCTSVLDDVRLPGTLAPGSVLLDTSRPSAGNAQCLLFARPERTLTALRPQDAPRCLEAVEEAVQEGWYVAGYLSYEAGYAFERTLGTDKASTDETGPAVWFGVYRAPLRLSLSEVRALLAPRPGEAAHRLSAVRFALGREAYHHRIERIKAHIREGDVYQINFTAPLRFGFEGAPLSLYRALRRAQHVPYGAFLNTGAQHVLSCSPELFFRREGDRIEARPMKGTVRRGRTQAEDAALRQWLAADEKSRAENLMIVDLLRNDLSVCCRPGTVQTPALFETEPYERVTQMTSTVEGRLRAGVGYPALFRALFPCGSVTGAPKIRAMQLIRALEEGPRGVYCGAIGYIGPEDEAVFNVAIRTVELRGSAGRLGIGSGVVWDSEAEAEYDECLLKADFLTKPLSAQMDPADDGFRLIETMRAEADAVALLDAHLHRLRESAAYFGFPLDEAAARAAVEEAVATLGSDEPHKVRLTLGMGGDLRVVAEPLRPRTGTLRITFARQPIDAQDPFFYHKTTHRRVYEAAYEEALAAGYDEAILTNQQGEVTEGTRANLFIKKGHAFYTPPVTCGLLGGVYRAHLLATLPNAGERVLHPRDLFEADVLYLCNAVRGVERAVLKREPIAS